MALSLKINIVEKSVTKTLQFDSSTSCENACRIIRDKCSDYPDLAQAKDYGLFLPGEAYGTGAWLEPGKTLDYYLLRNGDTLEYRRKIRTLRVRTLDGTNKTMMVDDSQNVANLMVVICTKMGITNHDEYSLVRDIGDENDNPNRPENHGTLTLKRRKEERERDPKLEQLRKKLKTDDELNWIDHTKTLREQGVEEWEVLILRRKFFFSDQNIDSHDPIQLNLLYVQARDAILDGTHPVTQEKACEFAGIQCQIQFGDHNATKHRTGFLELKEYLPGSYVKTKGIEKKVYAEHRRHMGMSELEAKSLYAKNARGLQTYGVTFFLVKEKVPGKNKLVPRLLGVTKDSVLRLDERTKEILKDWPLTTVRRWAASPNTFTLDFGDYSDQYYSVQTAEGEQIAQLIAGYIDIILKKKQAKDHLGIEGDEGSTLVEESVSPFRATIVQRQMPAKPTPLMTDSIAKPGVMHPGPEGINSIHTGSLTSSQHVTVSGQMISRPSQSQMQQYHTTDSSSSYYKAIVSGQEAVMKSREYLDQPLNLPPLGSDPASRKWKQTTLDSKKQNVQSQIAAMNAATAHVVLLTSTEEVNSSAVGEAVSAITSGLPDVAKDVRMIAALVEDNGESIVEATRKLCFAFSDLLKAAEPSGEEPRQNLLSAAGRVGDASRVLLSTIGEGDESQDLLLGLARGVANTSAALVLQAKKCATTVEDTEQREVLITSAMKTALSASELVACAKVVAPTVSNDKCRDELTDSARRVARSVEDVLSITNQVCQNETMKQDLQSAAREVSDSLNRLLDHIRPKQRVSTTEHSQDGAVDTILLATDKIITSEDPSDMVRQARILAQATAQLIQAIKGEAEKTPDSDQQKKLIAAAKVLAEATSRLVEAAKACASNPGAQNSQDVLRQAAQDLREATNMAAGGAVQKKSLRRLETAAKNAASAAAQTISASQNAAPQCNNATVRDALITECRTVADTIPQLVSAVKTSLHQSDESAQNGLVDATERFIRPSNSLIATSKKAVGFVDDDSSSRHLTLCTQKLAVELVELRTAMDRIIADSGLTATAQPKKQFDVVADRTMEIKEEIIACRKAAASKELRPLPGDNVQNSVQRLTSSVRKVSTCSNQLVNSMVASDTPAATSSAQAMLSGLSDLVAASRAVASTSNDTRVLIATETVVTTSWTLIQRSGELAGRNTSPYETESQLNPLKDAVHEALERVTQSIPGQKDLEDAIQTISSVSETLERRGRTPSGKNYGQLQSELQNYAADVAESSGNIVTSAANPTKLGNEARYFSQRAELLIDTGAQLASAQEDGQVREEIFMCLKNVTSVCTSTLIIARSVSLDADAPGSRNQLTAAARSVSECLNQLLDACSSAAPGQKECENAVRKIQSLKPLLDNPNEPVNSSSYFECQQIVVDNSKLLGDSMTGIANNAKEGDLEKFGRSVHSAADAICGLVESSAQAAYLLGAADPTSVAGKAGLVDMHSINDSARNIKSACQTLTSTKVTQQQVLSSATTIAKHTSSLCTSCRIASEKTTDATTKRQFVQMAKDVANATASLVKEIKALDSDQSTNKRDTCSKATASLVKSVDALVQYASQPEHLPMPAKISAKGRSLQEPVVSSGKNVILGSCNMLQAAKSLAINPKDPPTWQQLAQHSKHVSDSIKKLVTALREKAPGQKECEIAIQMLNDQLRRLNQASLAAVSQSLQPQRENNLQGFVQNSENAVRLIEEHVEPARQAGRAEAEHLGHQVSSLVSIIESLTTNIIGVASNVSDSREQVNILERSRTVLESGIQFVCAAKESGGNSKATNLHPELDLSAQCFQEGVDDLKMTLEQISSGVGGLVAFINESISAAMVKLNQQSAAPSSGEGYADFQTRMIHSAKEIAKLSSEMVSKAMVDPGLIPDLSSAINQHYGQLANDARGAVATIVSQDVGIRIRCGVQELGKACIELIRCGGAAQFSPDGFTQRDLMDVNRVVSEKVSDILSALQAGSRGTQACINAASTVSGIIGDLDTTIMFATAGTLHAEGDETFANQRENILKTAKALVEDTKTLVAGAASTQEQLAVAAQNAVATIVQLAEAVKFGAASLGSNNPESQVMLINAVRDVAGALYDLIHATKSAAGKGQNDPSMLSLKESAKIMVTNVTSLLKTVKAVEDEHTRGTRALEATIEAIAQEIRALESPDMPRGRVVTPEELVHSTKPVTGATAKAVAAGSSCRQDDVIVAANVGRKVIADLLAACKSAAFSVDGEMRERLLQAAKQIAVHYRELLQFVLHAVHHPGTDVKPQLSHSSKEIATAVTELVAVGQLMKGTDYADPEDPAVIAENELLLAANSIDAAAKKLEKLRPRRSIQEADETLNFDEMILEAAKSIAAATSALVKAACAAQRELVDTGRMSRKPATDSDDGQWSDGLISAAQMVAAATHSLVEAANALVQGHATEEKLISAAKQVASSTAQLLVACKVKASPDSDSMRRLQAAGNAVKRATDNLVKAAQQALAQDEELQVIVSQRMVGGIAQEIDARSDVIRKQRELEEAISRLAVLRKAKYQNKSGGGFIDDSDAEFEAMQETSRLDNLVESSAERINSANNAFSIMREQHQNSNIYSVPSNQSHHHYSTASFKPSISPKPTSISAIDRERKYNNSSPAYSTVSNESSVGYQPVMPQGVPFPPNRSQQQSGEEDLYARPRHPDQYYTPSTAKAGPPPPPPNPAKKPFLKPSEFIGSDAGAGQASGPVKGGFKVFPPGAVGTFGKPLRSVQAPLQQQHQVQRSTRDDSQQEEYQEEISHYDSGPVSSEEVYETATADGGVSLKRIFTKQQTSTTKNVVSSTKTIVQKNEGGFK